MPVSTRLRPRLAAFCDRFRQLIAVILVFASIFSTSLAAPLFAQVAAAPMMLHITILDGEDSLNNIRERTAREPIVQVEDENHKPVAGALLLFTIQNGGSGAGGTFNGLSTLSVTTDAQGRAVAHGLRPNQTSGTYTIGVTATLGALVATAVIHQTNAIGAGSGGEPNVPGTSETPPATPGAPPTPAAPTSTVAPGAPATTHPGAPTSETSAPTSGSGVSTPARISRAIRHMPKKVWITGATVVTVGVITGVIVATRGNNPTSITPGAGTVGP